MNIFCDTNIIAELVEGRLQADSVQRIFDEATPNDRFFVSAGSLYTITYLVDRQLRRQGIHAPERIREAKNVLWTLLDALQVVNIEQEDFRACLAGEDFPDLEDGYQYQAALACEADVLLTINIKDFKNVADQGVPQIMSPQEFVAQYL